MGSQEKVPELEAPTVEDKEGYKQTKNDDVDENVEADKGLCCHIFVLMLCDIRVAPYDSLISLLKLGDCLVEGVVRGQGERFPRSDPVVRFEIPLEALCALYVLLDVAQGVKFVRE